MKFSTTFGQKIAAGYAFVLVMLALLGLVFYRNSEAMVEHRERVAHSQQIIEQLGLLVSLLKDAETGQRGFVITGDEGYLEPHRNAVGHIDGALKLVRSLTADNPRQQRRIDAVEPLIAAKLAELLRTIGLRRNEGFVAASTVVRDNSGKQAMDEVRRLVEEMDAEERDLLTQRAAQLDESTRLARNTILFGELITFVLVALFGTLITRALGRQIGAAVQHIQSSSSELMAAANQQATGAREQATGMNEISTTISELLATSRQIAESAQRVTQIADKTAVAARAGDLTMGRAQEMVGSIKRQVDVIVVHMLDLGKKSQQIGGVLEIINELAEQTHILSINATIEAAGAGEVGKRFAVVADEIRKLADRVGGSTKEIRALIDEIRSAVNTTVMATEGGSKAVDAGSRQFSDVAASFGQIAGLVGTTNEAAREIELSTKQQSSAVEQVNLAVTTVAQASRESEASSAQMLQTSSELTALSRDLDRLIRQKEAA